MSVTILYGFMPVIVVKFPMLPSTGRIVTIKDVNYPKLGKLGSTNKTTLANFHKYLIEC